MAPTVLGMPASSVPQTATVVTACKLRGRDVLAVDGDRKGALMAAFSGRDIEATIACVQCPDGQALRQEVGKKDAITVSIDPAVLERLDDWARGRGGSRAAATAVAVARLKG